MLCQRAQNEHARDDLTDLRRVVNNNREDLFYSLKTTTNQLQEQIDNLRHQQTMGDRRLREVTTCNDEVMAKLRVVSDRSIAVD